MADISTPMPCFTPCFVPEKLGVNDGVYKKFYSRKKNDLNDLNIDIIKRAE